MTNAKISKARTLALARYHRLRGRALLAAWRWLDQRVPLPPASEEARAHVHHSTYTHVHTCTACPLEVRSLYASAANLVTEARAAQPDEYRIWRKAHQLAQEVDGFSPIVDRHFAATADQRSEAVQARFIAGRDDQGKPR